MGRHCEVCGRKIITGRKYCYLHKGYGRQNQIETKSSSKGMEDLFIWFGGAILLVIALSLVSTLLVILISTFILPLTCGIILFFKFRKLKKFGFGSFKKKELIFISIVISLLLFSIYWWVSFLITRKTLM